MKGIELSRRYFEEYGMKMLEEQFNDVLPRLAAGIVGEGSECFGFDDEISEDHDFEPGFCIFVPDNIDSRTEFQLERAYAKLPSEFMGYSRQRINPVGGHRHGVIKTGDFYTKYTGSKSGFANLSEWFAVPEFYLAEAVNGEIFFDNFGGFTDIRNSLMYYPEDVRLKKLAGNVLLMGQSGQYNYSRCLDHGQTGAAQLAAVKFSEALMNVIFLLNRRYMPYYKWSFKALSELEKYSEFANEIEFLISSSNGSGSSQLKKRVIESLCERISGELQEQKLSDNLCSDMEKHAYSINNHIKDNNLRNENVLFGV